MRTILVLAANPKDTGRLRLDEEVREIGDGLQRSKRRDEFLLERRFAVRPQDVRRAMLDLKPNIVHFCGHGAGDAGIAFEDEQGNAMLVDADTLAEFFGLFADTVECVVLNACYSDKQAKAIARNIQYVIGMKKETGDDIAIEFAVAFYDALGAGRPIHFAFRVGLNAIKWTTIPGDQLPVLTMRTEVSQFLKEVYDTVSERDFSRWSVFSTVGGFDERIEFPSSKSERASYQMRIEAFGTESVGVNKPLPVLFGLAEFEYRVDFSESPQPNVYFAVIPMEKTGDKRKGLIEVGTNVGPDPGTERSTFRRRFYVPMEHFGDCQWHEATIAFDFRQLDRAFYSIVAPRINEGCGEPAPARLLVGRVRVYSS